MLTKWQLHQYQSLFPHSLSSMLLWFDCSDTATCKSINLMEPFRQPLDLSPIFKPCTRLFSTYEMATQSISINSSLTRRCSYDSIVQWHSYLNGNRLSGTIPSTIGSLTNLQTLYGELSQPGEWETTSSNSIDSRVTLQCS